MRINIEMQVILNELITREGKPISALLDISVNELGNGLIKYYYQNQDIGTRELIRAFLTEAGSVWLRKLLTKDLSPIVSSRNKFASLDEYLSLLENDEVMTHFHANSAVAA